MNKRYLMLVMAIAISIDCGCSSNRSNIDASPSRDLIAASDMSRVDIPTREHGYSYLQNTVINSTTELNGYIQLVEQQSAWNNKAEFISVLQSETIDFDSMNFLIYFHTEGSGSIGVSLAEPLWEGENVVVNIVRTVPELLTGDMAYYTYAFKVNKAIPKVIFTIGETRIEIPNNDS